MIDNNKHEIEILAKLEKTSLFKSNTLLSTACTNLSLSTSNSRKRWDLFPKVRNEEINDCGENLVFQEVMNLMHFGEQIELLEAQV